MIDRALNLLVAIVCGVRRNFVSAIVLCTPLLLASGTGYAERLLISDVNVIDVDQGDILEHRDVLINNGRIARIHHHLADAPESDRVIDGAGRYLVPGYWDMHVHFRTRKFVDENPAPALVAENELLLPLYVEHGITSVFDMGTDIPERLQ